MSVRLDKEKDTESYAIGMLKDFYLRDYEKSPQEGFTNINLGTDLVS